MGPKLKSFCTSKETISKVKRQPSEWEINDAINKGLVPQICSLYISISKNKEYNKKMEKT